MLYLNKRFIMVLEKIVNDGILLYILTLRERWLSGLKRLPAKQESEKSGTRVRIPLSPPYFYPTFANATVGALKRLKRYGVKLAKFLKFI